MLSDEQLLKQIQGGQDAALEQLVERYYNVIYAYISRMLMNSLLAEDLTQECFMKVCSMVKQESLPVAFRPWLYRVAGNLCRDYWRKASTRLEHVADDEWLAAHPDRSMVASLVESRWEREEIIRQLNKLSHDERQMIVLRFYHELKISEIADIMGLRLNTLKTRLYKSFDKLAKLMRVGEEETGSERQRNVR